MFRTVFGDVVNGLFKTVDRFDSHFQGEKFRSERFFVGREEQLLRIVAVEDSPGIVVGINHHAIPGQFFGQVRQVGQPRAVYHQAVEGVANRRAACFGIVNNFPSLLLVAGFIENITGYNSLTLYAETNKKKGYE